MPIDLHRRQPGREGAGVVLGQHADEPLDRAELRRVDHDRLLPRRRRRPGTRARSRGGWLKSYWTVDICQVRPIASRACTEIFGPVEGRATRVGHQLEPGLDRDLLEDRGRGLPLLVGADELVLLRVVAGGQLEVEVVEAEVAEQAEAEVQQVLDLVGRLLGRDVGVRVVHLEPAHPGQAVHDAGLLVAVHVPELEQPQRQLAVGPAARAVDQVVHRAVHRLEVHRDRRRCPSAGTWCRRSTAGGRRCGTGPPW